MVRGGPPGQARVDLDDAVRADHQVGGEPVVRSLEAHGGPPVAALDWV
jgi:hypothetical protein